MGDQVAGGLVAGHHQRHEEQVELEVVEPLAVDLGLHQRVVIRSSACGLARRSAATLSQ